MKHDKLTREEVLAAEGKTLPDVITKNLRVLFCGINPGLYSAAVGHHFAGPTNRFWAALYASGFTHRLLSPFEDGTMPQIGLGLTNLVNRATTGEKGLTTEELIAGRGHLEEKVRQYRPRYVAILGIGVYRKAFGCRKVVLGRQSDKLAESKLWLLPNPSGLNAHYQLEDLAQLFAQLRLATEKN